MSTSSFRFIFYITTIFIFIHTFNSKAQVPDWLWAKSIGGTHNDEPSCITTDAEGNIYMVGGYMSDTIHFGSNIFFNSGKNDLFIVKYNSSGDVLWAKSIGGSEYEFAFSVTTDLNGNVLVTGNFYSPLISFDSITLNNTTPSTSADIFLAKFDTNGNVIWAKSAGGENLEIPYSVATDANGNIFITGFSLSNAIDYGSYHLPNLHPNDIFIAKYDNNGNIVWAKSVGGTTYDYSHSITVDVNGDILVAGNFTSPTITFDTIALSNTGLADIFLAKYDNNGSVLWVKSAGGGNTDVAYSVITDKFGNIFITGYFHSSIIYFNNLFLMNSAGKDMFIAKYNSDGNIVWAQNESGDDYASAYSVTADSIGNIYVCGDFGTNSITFSNYTLVSKGDDDLYVVKYDNDGNILWAKGAGGADSDLARSVSIDKSGNLYVAGEFSSPITFDSITLSNCNHMWDIFLAKIASTYTDIKLNKNIDHICIYPNPSNGKFCIISGKIIDFFEVYNLLGEKIFHSQARGVKIEIDLSTRPKGIYIVRTKIGERNYTEKVIIE